MRQRQLLPGRADDARTDGGVPRKGAGAAVAMNARKDRTMNTGIRLGLCLAVGLMGGSLLAADSRSGPPPVRPKTYGTSQDSIYHVPITEFVPLDGGWVTRDYSFPGSLARYTTNCAGPCMYAIPHLPNGAL